VKCTFVYCQAVGVVKLHSEFFSASEDSLFILLHMSDMPATDSTVVCVYICIFYKKLLHKILLMFSV